MSDLGLNLNKLTEEDTKTKLITPAIENAGWDIRSSEVRQEFQISAGRIDVRYGKCKREKPLAADYVLFRGAKPIAVIEAKKASCDVRDGMGQAINYAARLDAPFAFSSNGLGFVFYNDYITSGEKESNLAMDEFPSPETLWKMYLDQNPIDPKAKSLISTPYYSNNPDRAPRYYQITAINRAAEKIASGENRVLLVMATGTGKTYVAFQIIYRLWKAGLKKRILFLADRKALIQQTATSDFSYFGNKMLILSRKNFDLAHEVYLALYQGLSTDGEEPDNSGEPDNGEAVEMLDCDENLLFKEFKPDFFDLIVVDECHRGSARDKSPWRGILEYFSSAAQIGLTATPKETKDVSNIEYFGDPIYTYSLKQGIEDGYLAPYRVIRVFFDSDVEGYIPLPSETDADGKPLDPAGYGVKDYDRTVILGPRTELVAKIVSKYLKDNNCRKDKTIFFCVDQEHAGRMREALVNENSDLDRADKPYVVRMTANDPYGVNLLDRFRDTESDYPMMATTSKLLTTGVDIPSLKCVVLDSNINSMTEFKQIIGRGTRICEDAEKFSFTIFDFRNVTRLFHDPNFDGECVQSENYCQTKEDIVKIKDPKKPKKDPVEKTQLPDRDVRVIAQTTESMGADGRLTTENIVVLTKKKMNGEYAELKDFLADWNAAERKTEIINRLQAIGIPFEELAEKVGRDYDPFDLICHVVYDRPPLTRRERVKRVQKRNYFAKYGEAAAKVLNEILAKYAENGLGDLESLDVLTLAPINEFGSKLDIIRLFGDKNRYQEAITELEKELYAV